jgi:hypothetical protein
MARSWPRFSGSDRSDTVEPSVHSIPGSDRALVGASVIAGVTGGRDHWPSLAELEALAAGLAVREPDPAKIILRDGDCITGVDRWARRYCVARGLAVSEPWSADWATHGRAAGPIRNRAMIGGAPTDLLGYTAEPPIDVLFAFAGGIGTADAVAVATGLGIPVVPIPKVREPRIWNRHFPTAPCAHELATYVGRGTPLGNPYKVDSVEGESRNDAAYRVLGQYREWLLERYQANDPEILGALDAITADSFLVCSCWTAHCHAEVIVRAWRHRQRSRGDRRAA